MNAEFVGVAHGRVNVIGEHTDYNDGWVLPTAIPQATRVRVVRRSDARVVVEANPDPHTGRPRRAEYALGTEERRGDWADYVRGATRFLAEAGHAFGGFEARIESNVPEGSGLSSSAALEIALVNALAAAFSLPIEGVERARLGRKIENDFVGARVGIMDQMACVFARWGEALFLDTRTMARENIALPLERMDLVVVNSGVAHRHAGGDYNTRRAECEEAAARLGVASLRDLGPDASERIAKIPDPLRARARHVWTENRRVHDAVAAIRSGDLPELGRLLFASHASLRDDYAVSIPELDFLVDRFRETPGVYGARLTGGGFGGSILAFCKKNEGRAAAEGVMDAYRSRFRETPTLLVPESAP